MRGTSSLLTFTVVVLLIIAAAASLASCQSGSGTQGSGSGGGPPPPPPAPGSAGGGSGFPPPGSGSGSGPTPSPPGGSGSAGTWPTPPGNGSGSAASGSSTGPTPPPPVPTTTAMSGGSSGAGPTNPPPPATPTPPVPPGPTPAPPPTTTAAAAGSDPATTADGGMTMTTGGSDATTLSTEAATTAVNATTTSAAPSPAAPLPESLSYAAEGRARGVLTLCAALMSPVIGPSGIFETTRALAVFSFARCSRQSFSEVLDSSTKQMPWPEAIIPMQVGGLNNGHLRGVFVSNMIIVPLVFWIATVLYGFFGARKRPGKWQAPPGPPPTSKLGGFWLTYCEWMYWGSTVTFLVVIFALGFDGAISALFAIFATSVETSDTGGDFVLCMIYVIVVPVFLFRIASQIYSNSPSRFFMTPGQIRIKEGTTPPRPLPEWAADFFGGKWGAWLVVGQWCWRPGSHKSYHMMREVACLYRRFLGPNDEDRSIMAVEMLAKHQEFMKKREAFLKAKEQADAKKKVADEEAAKNKKKDDEEEEAGKKEKEGDEGADAEKKVEEEEKKPSEADAKKEEAEGSADAEASASADGAEKKEDDKATTAAASSDEKKAAALVAAGGTNKGWCASIKWGLQIRRIVYADFLFFEFIFVFFISMFKGLARVSMDPDSCYSNAMGAAVFNLFFFLFILIVRPFAVPLRNVLSIISSFLAMLANFLATSESGADAAVGLAIFAAIFPFFYLLIIAVPRLLMRFMWGLQHAPGAQVPLRDPSKPPPPPPSAEELAKQKAKEESLSLKAAVNPELQKQKEEEAAALARKAAEKSDPLLAGHNKDETMQDEEAAAMLGIKRGGGAGPLTQLAHMFFPPPIDRNSMASDVDLLGADDADSFGDDDDDDDDAYLDRMVMQRYSNPSQSRSSSAAAAGHPDRDVELQSAVHRLEHAHRALEDQVAQQHHQRAAQAAQLQSPGGVMTSQFVPQVYSPPRGLGGGFDTPPAGSPSASPQAGTPQQQQRQAMVGYVQPGSGRAANPRIAQQTALAQLLVHIVDSRKGAASISLSTDREHSL